MASCFDDSAVVELLAHRAVRDPIILEHFVDCGAFLRINFEHPANDGAAFSR